MSAARLILQGARRPVRTATRVAGFGIRWVRSARTIASRVLRDRWPCRLRPIVEQRSDQASVTEAVRWLGPLTLTGETRDALYCHPTSRVVYRFEAPARARVVAHCALMPDVWAKNQGGVEFSVTVLAEQSGTRVTRTLRSDPGRRTSDRRWRRLTVAVPGSPPQRVEVILETRIPAGERPDWAWAIWGEPALERPRPLAELSQHVRATVGEWRLRGFRAAVRRLRAAYGALSDPTGYGRWVAQHAPADAELEAMRAASERFEYRPLISVVMPVYNQEPRWLRLCVESVRRQAYPNWEFCICDDGSTLVESIEVLRSYGATDPRIRVCRLSTNSGIAVATQAALDMATGEFIALLDSDDELAPHALFENVRHLNEHPDTDFIYSDEDKFDFDGSRCDVFFKPDWSPEHLLSAMYTCHLTVARRALAVEAGGFRKDYEGSQDYDLALRLIERTSRIHHLPQVLYHWRKIPLSGAASSTAKPHAHVTGRRALEDYVRRNRLDAEVVDGEAPCVYRVRFAIEGEPLVSIIVTTGPEQIGAEEASQRLERTIRTVVERTAYRRHELLVMTEDGRLPGAVEPLLSGLRYRVLVSGPGASVSRQVNLAAAQARGQHLLLCDHGLEALDPGWLTALLEFSQQTAIGAVGGKLLYPDGRLKHIGILLGVGGAAAPALHQYPASSYGYFSSAIGTRDYSAVSRSCLMTRRQVFERLGGFSEEFVVRFNDVDYCLRARRAGYRVVFTPYAQLVQWGPDWSIVSDVRADDARRLRARWGETLDDDPYYNPNLSRETPDYRPAV